MLHFFRCEGAVEDGVFAVGEPYFGGVAIAKQVEGYLALRHKLGARKTT